MPRFEPLPERRPAIVAGASSGIGEATAIELAARGFPVALGARRVEKLNELVGKIQADGGEAVGFHLDVTDPNSVKSFVSQSVEALGDIEVLVAGAGDTFFGKLDEITPDVVMSLVTGEFLGAQSDEWITRFYAFLYGHSSLWPAARAANLSASSLAPNISTARSSSSRASTMRPMNMRIIARPRIPLSSAGRLPHASAAAGNPSMASRACGNWPRTTLAVASQKMT